MWLDTKRGRTGYSSVDFRQYYCERQSALKSVLIFVVAEKSRMISTTYIIGTEFSTFAIKRANL